MARTGTRTPTIEARILAALRVAHRRGLGGLTVAELHTQPGLTGRPSYAIAAAAERLVDRGDVVPGWRRTALRRHAVDLPAGGPAACVGSRIAARRPMK